MKVNQNKTTGDKGARFTRGVSDRFDGAKQPVGLFDTSTKANITVNIENKEGSSKVYAVFTGLLNDVAEINKYAGAVADYIATEGPNQNGAGTVINFVSADGLPFLRRFLNGNPMAVTALQIQTKDQYQMSKKITYKRVHPVRRFGEETLVPQNYQLAKDANTNLVNIDVTDMVLGDQSILLVEVAAFNWTSITFFFGNSRDDHQLMTATEASKA